MAKKKIVHLTYDMRIGGTETVIKNLVEGVDKSKFEVEILCIEQKLGPFGEQLIEQGCKITNLNWLGGFDTQIIKQIRQYVKTNHIDILHCHQYTPWVYGALAAAFTNTKVVFTEHGRFYPDSSSLKRKLINPILLWLTDHVTAISKATKQALVDFEFIPESQIKVIYNGIKPLVANKQTVVELREELQIPNDAKVVGTVARLDPIKNQTMMIKAFAMALKECPKTFLLVVGDGEERTKLENLVDKLKIRENVIFTGYIAKPVNHIALMDIFLLSSLSEGTSMTLLEAISLGKPCVVTDAGGNPEIITQHENGIVSPNNKQNDFAQAIMSLLNKPDLYEGMTKMALATFNQRFDAKIMNRDFVKQYSQ